MDQTSKQSPAISDKDDVDIPSTPRLSSFESRYATPNQDTSTTFVMNHVPTPPSGDFVPRPPSTAGHVPRLPTARPTSRHASFFKESVMRRSVLGRPGSGIYRDVIHLDGTTRPFSPHGTMETSRMGLGGNTDSLVGFYESKHKETSDFEVNGSRSPGLSSRNSLCRSRMWAASPMYINGDRLYVKQDKVGSLVTVATHGENNGNPAMDEEIDIVDGGSFGVSTEPPTLPGTDDEGIPGIACDLEVVGKKVPVGSGSMSFEYDDQVVGTPMDTDNVFAAKPAFIRDVPLTPYDDRSSRLEYFRSSSEDELLQLDEEFEQHINYALDLKSAGDHRRRRMLGATAIGFIASQDQSPQQTIKDAHAPDVETRGRKKTRSEKKTRRSNGRDVSGYDRGMEKDDVDQKKRGKKKKHDRRQSDVRTGLDEDILPPVVADGKHQRVAEMNAAKLKNLEARREGSGAPGECGKIRIVGDYIKAVPSFHRKLRNVDGKVDRRPTPSASEHGDFESCDNSSATHIAHVSNGKKNRNRLLREDSTGSASENEARRKRSQNVVMIVDNHDYNRKPHPPRSSISPVPECLPALPKGFMSTTKTPNERGVDLKELAPASGGQCVASTRRIGSAMRNIQKDKIDVSGVSALVKRHKPAISDKDDVDIPSTPRLSSFESRYATPNQDTSTTFVMNHVPTPPSGDFVPRPPSTAGHVPRLPTARPTSRHASFFKESVMRRSVLGRPGSGIYRDVIHLDGTTRPFSPHGTMETSRMGLGGNTDSLVGFYESKHKETSDFEVNGSRSPGLSSRNSLCRSRMWAASPMYINGDRLYVKQDKVGSLVTVATHGENNGNPAMDEEIDIVDGGSFGVSTEPPTLPGTDDEGIPGIACDLEVVGKKVPVGSGSMSFEYDDQVVGTPMDTDNVFAAKPAFIRDVPLTPYDDRSSRLEYFRSSSEDELLQLDEEFEQHINYALDLKSAGDHRRRRMLGATAIGFIASQDQSPQQTIKDAHAPDVETRGRKKTRSEKKTRRSNGRDVSGYDRGMEKDDVDQKKRGKKKKHDRRQSDVRTGLDEDILPPVVADGKHQRVAEMNAAKLKNLEARREGSGAPGECGKIRIVGDCIKAVPSFHRKLRNVDGKVDRRPTPSASEHGDFESCDNSSATHIAHVSNGKKNRNRLLREDSTGSASENEARRKRSQNVVMIVDNHDYNRKPHPPRSSISPVPECLPALPKGFMSTTKTPNERGVDLKELAPASGGQCVASTRRIGSAMRNIQKDKIDVSGVSALVKRHK